jgi:hypothetical protein
MIKPSLFTALSTYKPGGDVNPEENFSTELLVHLLRHSLKTRTPLFGRFAGEFLGGPVSVTDYSDVTVETRALFYTDRGVRAFPDITVKTKDGYLFIEVKVEAGLNYYEVDDGENATETVDQIEHYQGIRAKPKSVYLLTKHPCELNFEGCSDFKGKFRWHRIHGMLKHEYETGEPVEKYLVREIIGYMEDKGMSIEKVTFELVRGMEMLNNLFPQIKAAIEDRKPSERNASGQMGYDLLGGAGWVGNLYEGHRLVFVHRNPSVIKHIEEKKLQGFGMEEKEMRSSFDFEERRYFCLSAEEQVKAIKEWVDENYRLIEEYGG